MRHNGGALGVALVVALLVACAPGEPDGDATAVLDEYAGLHALADRVVPEHELADLLPNRTFAVAGGDPQPAGAGVVLGTVSDARPLAAYDGAGEVPWDSADAAWWVMDVTIDVDDSFGATVAPQVHVGMVGDPSRLSPADYLALGRVLVALGPRSFYDGAPDIYQVRDEVIAQVGDGGELVLTTYGADARAFQGGIATVDELTAQATLPSTTIAVDGTFQRS